ncbi:MAG: response regulator [Owenweeksia sp.]
MKTKLLLNQKVLLIEDDEVHQMLLTFMLKDQGALITLEPDKAKALEKLKTRQYDLVLLDTRLGNTNALGFTQLLREELQLNIPIIGMSSVNLQGRGIYNGLDEVLIRPVEYSHLVETLNNLKGRMKAVL